MKSKTKKIVGISLLAVLVASICVVVTVTNDNRELYEVDQNEKSQAYKLLKDTMTTKKTTYYDFKLENDIVDSNLNGATASVNNFNVVSDSYNYSQYDSSGHQLNKISYGDSLQYNVSVEKAGLYEVEVDYLILGDNVLAAPIIEVSINDTVQYEEASAIQVPILWKGIEEEFPTDSYGDETIPLNNRDTTTWQTLQMYDNLSTTSTPLTFKLNQGANKININYISGNCDVLFGKMNVNAPKKYMSYKEYEAANNAPIVSSLSGYNAIYYSSKNSSYVSLGTENSPSVTPYSSSKNHLNVISVDAFDDSGQSISYEIEAKETGMYNLAFHYQNDKAEFDSFRTIMIDNEVLFEECFNYAFEPTSSGMWKNETLSIDGEPMKFYLTKGKHILTLKAENNNVAGMCNEIQTLIDHINYFALEILKITGSDVDADRTWKLTEYISNTEPFLKAYDVLIKSIVNEGSKYSSKSVSSASLSYLNKAVTTLRKLMKKPDELPLYLANLYSGSSSINSLLGSSITTLQDQPLGLDMIYLYANDKLPRDNASVFKRLGSSITRTFNAYTSDKYKTNLDEDVVNVWVNKPLTYINILQQMVDGDYNANTTGKKVKISMMPDANKLLLATAANECPDVALGLASYVPFDFAIRNAAYDLTSFSDFYSVAAQFPSGIMVPYLLNDKFYAIPESLDFQATIYRSDIFDTFSLNVPDTWDDLIHEILPTLQRYGMNYYLPTSADNSTKWFYQTVPMIYQYGGQIYNEDGLSTAIDSEEALQGLTLLTNLYRYYSLSSQVKSFYNNFRAGTNPIGVTSFADYLLIKNAAPEIVGKWELSAPLGVKGEDGTVNRTYISNGTSGMIFKSSSKPEDSWDFLKWWTSTSTQIEYSTRLQSTYGPEYTWLSSNVEAVKESSIDNEDKQVIIDSLEWIADVPRTPGQYMVERGLSNIWTEVALQNAPLGVSIDSEVLLINREIIRKMKEFNYLDTNGNILNPFIVREKQWVSDLIKEKVGD